MKWPTLEISEITKVIHKVQNPARHTMPVERLNQYQNVGNAVDEPWDAREMFQSRHNINKFTSKLKSMVTDLNQTVAGEIDKNNKLNHNINQLKKALEMEKKRTVDVDQRLRDEFKEYKKNENEKIEHHERLSNRLNEIKMELGEWTSNRSATRGKQNGAQGRLGQARVRKRAAQKRVEEAVEADHGKDFGWD